MNQDLLLYVMAGFVAISAVALCIQAALLFGIYKASKLMGEQVTSVVPQAKAILSKTESVIDLSKKHILDITEKASDIVSIARTQMEKVDSLVTDVSGRARVQMDKVDALVTDASSRARAQMDRAELVVDDTMGKVQSSVSAVHHGIVRPIREVNGIATGVKTAVSVFFRGNRPSVAQVTQEDEMFI